jgi:4-carboxymuconolactone decarboxylase
VIGGGLTPEQQQAAEEFKRLRGVDPFGPFIPLLTSPELMLRVSALGEYLRYRSALQEQTNLAGECASAL